MSHSYHNLFEVISNEAIIGFITFDCSNNNSQCTFANLLAKELLEVQNKNLTEITLFDLFPGSNTSNDLRSLNENLLEHEGLYQDILIKKMNGMKFIANVGIKHVLIGEKRNLLLMLQDVTLQKKLQKEINLKQEALKSAYEEVLGQNKQLMELDVAKNRFIALTTHELRTPLSAMLGSAELLKEKLYDNDEQHDEFVDMIYEQGHHLMELVNDILDFSKIQSGKMDFYIAEDSPLLIVEMIADSLKSMAEQDSIQIQIETQPHEDHTCYFDKIRLKQVIGNILSNAIKYNKPHGKVFIQLTSDEDFTTVSFKDTGKGILPEHLEKVFDEFETLGKVANHQKGTGLGMPITRRLMQGMGGNIELESEFGVGSRFWVKIPRKKVLEDSFYRERLDDFDLAAS